MLFVVVVYRVVAVVVVVIIILLLRIAIVGKGKLRAVGTPLHLKNLWAKGYRLVVSYDKDEQRNMINEITNVFDNTMELVVINTFAGTIEVL